MVKKNNGTKMNEKKDTLTPINKQPNQQHKTNRHKLSANHKGPDTSQQR